MTAATLVRDFDPQDRPPRRPLDAKRYLTIAALLGPGVLIVAGGLFWPMGIMFGMSFQDRYPYPTALTLEAYRTVLGDAYFLRIIGRTFMLSLVVTVITAILGYPLAWFLVRSQSKWKHLVFLAVISPLLVSIIVRTIGWTIILGNEGMINAALVGLGIVKEPVQLMQSFWSVVVGMVHVLMPFMVLSISTVLGKIDTSYAEAAKVLGANPARTFLKITLPLSIQGIMAGSIIVFCLTAGAYVTPVMLGRGKVSLLAVNIQEQMVVLVDWPTGAAVAMVLTVGTLAALLLSNVVLRRHSRR
jgi:putative spermidine/putrescine transport system permease protein